MKRTGPRIVFATCNAYPDYQESDRLVAGSLEAAGARVEPAPWNGDPAPFDAADLIVIRSTWDYPSAAESFRRWLLELRGGAPVVNDPMLMCWNMTKRYLTDLDAKGAPIPPTRFIAPTAGDVAAAMDALGLAQAVVKPVIGASASGLTLTRREDAASLKKSAAALGPHAGLVQPVLADIKTRGETSLIYLEGRFSHGVVKRPAAGDIRCQSEFGGSAGRVAPPQWAVAEGLRILEMLPDAPLYARIDAIVLDETLQLMEVEVIEPELFFTEAPDAAARFAAALMKKLN